MTLSQLSFDSMRVLGVISFVLLSFCIFGLVRLAVSKLGRVFAVSYLLFILILLTSSFYFDAAVNSKNADGFLSAFSSLFGALPLWSFILLLSLTAAGAAAVTVVVGIRIKRSLTPASLLEGLDEMPDGICYSDESGASVLMNRKMQHIINAALGAEFTGTEQLKDISAEKLCPGCRTETKGDGTYLILPDETVWDMRTGSVRYGKERFDECIAYDVTEQYGKSLEMQKRNEHMRTVNEQIRAYSREMDAIIRDRELLDAKIRIHDDMGRALLSLRSYLGKQERDREALTTLWRVTVSVLRCETAPDVSADRMTALSDAAEAVGVRLHFDGEIPKGGVTEKIYAAAVRECLTNTVKHADGGNLYISSQSENGCFTVKIKNDGRPPSKPVVETGGLLTLRKSVVRAGGEMSTEWENGFELTIKLCL